MADEGIVDKYEVKRLNDVTGKHKDCRFFVLDPAHDSVARYALASYANLAYANGQESLSQDIYDWLNEIYEGME